MTTVTFELESEQLDAIMASELKNQIYYSHNSIENNEWIHEDDRGFEERLLAALWVVYEYFSGPEQASELKKELQGENYSD